MNAIFAENIWKENRPITKKYLINEKFDCDIFINEIKLSGNMTVNQENNITFIFNKNYTDLSSMFSYCSSLTSINLSNFNTNNVTNMGSMFSSCSSLTSINLSNFNTNNVTNMSYMFYSCKYLTYLDISNLNCDKIKKTTYLDKMFENCNSLKVKNIKLNDFKIRQQAIVDLMNI